MAFFWCKRCTSQKKLYGKKDCKQTNPTWRNMTLILLNMGYLSQLSIILRFCLFHILCKNKNPKSIPIYPAFPFPSWFNTLVMERCRKPFDSAGRLHPTKTHQSTGRHFCLYADGTEIPPGVSLTDMTIKIEIWVLNTLHRSQAQGIFCWSP